ncbi:extracellular solute-binding protein [Mesorhizobium sp. ESP6-5]|uniref:extracellular solute-binding protein n=1 Tax=unclassified Mesorhizobium TaxID=325217 RepID=UPI0011273E55|nr:MULTISPECIES: extracellular solute-binding protein [unclassified Mesorhizobium]MBZ9759178.1 extracellular solute-binding protein [Mesorhizobium sp. ESP6-5]TPK00896.1 extracellular solute-binding protein [Mesorhizobium sp. B2-5-9]
MSMLSIHRRAALGLIGGLAAAGAGIFTTLPAKADSTVTLWSWRTEDEAAMRRIFDAFEAKNPGIKVNIQFTPDADYQNRLSTALRGGRGPDIAQLKAYGELQPFVDAGYLDVLDDNVPELKNMPAAALGGARGRTDGKFYGVPYSVPMMGVFYNQDIFAAQGIEIPKTYKDFTAACEKLKAAGITPIATGGANGSAWELEIGVGVVGPTVYGPGFYDEMMTGKATFEDPRYVAALKRFAELKPYFPDGFAGIDYTTATQQFIGGKAAMFLGGSFENGSFKAQNPKLKFSIFPFPADDAGAKLYTSAFSDGSYGLVSESANKDAAIKVLDFMASAEFAQMFADELGWPPARTDVTVKDPVLAEMMAMSKNSTPYLTLVGFRWQSPTASSVLQSEIIDMVEGNITPEKLAADMQAAVATWFKPKQ